MSRTALPLLLLLLCGAILSCAQSGSRIDESRRLQLEAWWDLYQVGDPSWPDARSRWMDLDEPEREVLVMSLVRDMVRLAPVPVRAGESLEPGWKRPQKELVALGADDTVPVLIEALRTGRDPVSLEPISQTLAMLGAVDSLIDVLDLPREGDSSAFPGFAYSALVRAGGARAINRVGEVLRSDPDWKRRSSAADALKEARYSDRRRASSVLLEAVEDSDAFVATRSLESLAILDVTEAAPRVALAFEQAVRRRDERRARAAVDALRRLTGRRVKGDDPVLWKQVAKEAAEEAKRNNR